MKVKDPVCGMTIEDKDAAGTSIYQGKTYFFCSTSCKEKFDKNPEAYAEKKTHENNHTTESCPTCSKPLIPDKPHRHSVKAEWTCPMHPEIR
jgi:YHS domain-containing protein